MSLANAFSRQRYLAPIATAAIAISAVCLMVLSSGPTGGRIVSQIENDLGALSTKLVQIVSQLFFPLVTLAGVINRPN